MSGVGLKFLFLASYFMFLFGVIGSFASYRSPRIANWISHLSSLVGGVFSGLLALLVLLFNKMVSITAWEIVPGVTLSFRVDSLSAFFLLLLSLLVVSVSLYSLGYVKEYYGRKSVSLLAAGFALFIVSMMAVVTVDNSFTFLMAWEFMSLVSFLLVMLEHEKADVRNAGYVYVVMTHLGTGFIFLSFLTLYLLSGHIDFAWYKEIGAMLPQSVKNMIFIASFIGFGTKAGLIPLHVWLPRAHPAAPSHISALMSAVMIKTAIYGMIRFIYDFLGGGSLWWGAVILGVGVITAVLGILYGLMENDIKRFLAYSSAENMGIIFMGLGCSLIFGAYHHPALGALALTASLYHVFNHGVFKGLLFMGAGAVLYGTHTKNVEQLGGLIRKMPWTGFLFLIGGLSLSAFPPFNGFISEWVTFQSLLHLAFDLNHPGWKVTGGILAALLGITGAFVAGGFVKIFGTAFLAMPRTSLGEQAKEVPYVMHIGMGILAVASLLLGIWPEGALRMTHPIVGQYFPVPALQGGDFLLLPVAKGGDEGLSLGVLLLAFILILGASGLLLRLFFGKSKNQVGETWNCGTPLHAGMEYTGTSFSHPILRIFQWIYRPHPMLDRYGEHPYFPKKIRYNLQIRPFFEEILYKPLVRFILYLSKEIRLLQNGNLQSYLAYMIVTLILLLVWAR